MNIVHVFSDSPGELNSSHWRGKIPCEALRRAGYACHMPHVEQWFRDTPQIRQMCSDADLIIVQRVLVEESNDRVRYWRERGKAVVVDIDDAYQLLPPFKESGNQAAKFWNRGEVDINMQGGFKYTRKLEVHPLHQFAMAARMCSGITMPSRILAEDWQWTAPVYYIPNFIDSPRYLAVRDTPRPPGEDLIIGWGGSMSHLPSFRKSGILEALRRVFQKRKRVKFLLAGDDRIMPLLPLPDNRKVYQPYVMWTEWPKVMHRMDITVAPMVGRYDASRSWIKCVEAGVMGIPCIASRSAPYQDWMDSGLGIFTSDDSDDARTLSDRAEEWEELLLDVIDHYPEYKSKAGREIEFAMTKDVDRNVDYIVGVYEQIVEHEKYRGKAYA